MNGFLDRQLSPGEQLDIDRRELAKCIVLNNLPFNLMDVVQDLASKNITVTSLVTDSAGSYQKARKLLKRVFKPESILEVDKLATDFLTYVRKKVPDDFVKHKTLYITQNTSGTDPAARLECRYALFDEEVPWCPILQQLT
ncbi:hypothetical protein HDV05_007798 [Chytridiales sp. JEL 0842]|nr:hypothetical protein HDV05_007798 [Chytridiales sp. JEL 0842]